VTIKNDNFRGLLSVCAEFHFLDLGSQLSQFRESDDSEEKETMEDFEIRMRQSGSQASTVETLLGSIARLEAETSALRCVTGTMTMPAPKILKDGWDACMHLLALEMSLLRCGVSWQSRVKESAESRVNWSSSI
jgi:hypothetical protein